MTTLSNGRCYGLGQLIPAEWPGTWEELLETQDWEDLIKDRNLGPEQIWYIQKGFENVRNPPEPEAVTDDNQIVPFGKFKGKRFSELPDRYILWLVNEDWLDKWPTLSVYAKKRKEKLSEGQATLQEVKSILQPIK